MMNFKSYDWENAKIVLDFFKQPTTCLNKEGLLCVQPKYVVAIDDDMISAFYAAKIMLMAKKQFGKYPKLLCVGGLGMLSKYMNRLDNGIVISEGEKLRMVAMKFGDFPISVLDNGTNTGANLKEIIDYLYMRGDENAAIVFCLTQRLSKRMERTIAFTTKQFPGTEPLNAYYYVPGESLEQMCQLYNGKGLAGGLPLLSEIAAVYDRCGTTRYSGRYMADYDCLIPKYVLKAGKELVDKYPVRVSRTPLVAPMQFLKMLFAVKFHRKEISLDLEKKIESWSKEL